MARILATLLLVLACPRALLAQPERAWVHRYDGPFSDQDSPAGLAVDASGHVYVAGSTYGPAGHDMTTIKLSPDGSLLWADTYNGPGSEHDEAVAIGIDGQGFVYVVGSSAGNDAARRPDAVLIKYAPDGQRLWVRRHDSPANAWTYPAGLAVDAAGNAHVVAYTYGSAGSFGDFMTFKFDAAGTLLWSMLYSGPGANADIPHAIAIDPAGNVVVTGSAVFDFSRNYADLATVKYGPGGAQLWARSYRLDDGAGALDEAYDIAADQDGNVYVAGMGTKRDSSTDFVLIKYDAAGGESWVRIYDGAAPQSDDAAAAVALDRAGRPVAVGRTIDDYETYYDFRTLEYSPAGDPLWSAAFNHPDSFLDGADDVAIDPRNGTVYVLGTTNPPEAGVNYDWALVAYSAGGAQLWADHFGGPANFWDFPSQVVVDQAGNVYVTGQSWAGNLGDYLTIKYEARRAVDAPPTGPLTPIRIRRP